MKAAYSEWWLVEINGRQCRLPIEMLAGIDPAYYRLVARS